VQTFLGELEPRCEAIQEAIRRGDRAVVTRVAHTLKSSARLVGADELARLCSALEANPDSVDLGALARACRRTGDDLRAFA
jgi:HPt (histidine-containing phosphotransfer) domain-containing protein